MGLIKNNDDKHSAQFGIGMFRVGLVLYAREYFKYGSWFISPALSVDFVNGNDFYIDIEIKWLFFGGGIRFIWLKKKTKKVLE